jgi:hypothetical protein
MSAPATLFPSTRWAQRIGSLFVTLDLPDVQQDEAKIELGPKTLSFTGKSAGKSYSITLEFLEEIDDKSPETKWQVRPRNVSLFILSSSYLK